MPFLFKIKGEADFECKNFYFNEERNSFILEEKGSDSREIEFDYSLKKDIKFNKNVTDFEYTFLYKNDYAENDIWNIFEDKLIKDDINSGRIGWLFPLQALTSRDHNYVSKDYFYPYSFNAYIYLLGYICKHNKTFEYDSLDQISIVSLFGEDVHILVLYNDYTKNITDFDLENYIPSLIEYGYFFIRNRIHYKHQISKIKLESISKVINNTDYIKNIFKDSYIKSYDDQFIRFYFLYQIIELLLEEIFQDELSNVLNDFNAKSKDFFEIKEDLNSITKEKYRIDQLFSNYSKTPQNKPLITLIKNYISKVEPYNETSVSKAIYKLRSLLFHNHRKINSIGLQPLKDINDLFEEDIFKILKTYKKK